MTKHCSVSEQAPPVGYIVSQRVSVVDRSQHFEHSASKWQHSHSSRYCWTSAGTLSVTGQYNYTLQDYFNATLITAVSQ